MINELLIWKCNSTAEKRAKKDRRPPNVYVFAVEKVARRRTNFIMIFTTAGFPSSGQFRNEN